MGVAAMVKLGRANRPPVHACFQHAEWRKIWMHILETMGVAVNDEFEALSAAKDLEARLFLQLPQEDNDLQSREVPPGYPGGGPAESRSEKIAVFLHQAIVDAIYGDNPSVAFLKRVLAPSGVGVEGECTLLLISLAYVIASEEYGTGAAEEVLAGVVPQQFHRENPVNAALARDQIRSYISSYYAGPTETALARLAASAVAALGGSSDLAVRRAVASHAPWMTATHHRSGDKALLTYNVSKAPELSNPMDLSSAPTGNTCYVLSEVYETKGGVADHYQQANDSWSEFPALGTWLEKCQVTVVSAAPIFASLW